MSVKEFFKDLVGFIDDLLFPEYSCFMCGREAIDLDYHLCEKCKKSIPILKGVLCSKCGHPLIEGNDYCNDCRARDFVFDEARAVMEYNEDTRRNILGIKYRNQKYMAKFFARLMLDVLIEWGIDFDIMIPVPLSESRKKYRGYNQSELIADELANVTGLPVLTKIITKKEGSTIQRGLGYNERVKNMTGMFEVDKRYNLSGKKVLIIDDMFTTGATVNEISRMLKKLNPDRIYVLTVGKKLSKLPLQEL